MNNNGNVLIQDNSKKFAPEQRLEGTFSGSSFKYKIYYTDMFYNSAAIEKMD
jgi:hypothetical protein